MLPDPRQVGEPQIDHPDLLVLDRLQEIFGCRTIRNHGFAPVPERGALKIMSPFSRCQAAWGGFWSTFHLRRRCRTDLIRLGGARMQERLLSRANRSFSSGAARA